MVTLMSRLRQSIKPGKDQPGAIHIWEEAAALYGGYKVEKYPDHKHGAGWLKIILNRVTKDDKKAII
jgi:hypothetical protein